LDRNGLTGLFAAAEEEAGYALVCLLGRNGLRVSEACRPNADDPGGSPYQPTLRIIGKGDKHDFGPDRYRATQGRDRTDPQAVYAANVTSSPYAPHGVGKWRPVRRSGSTSPVAWAASGSWTHTFAARTGKHLNRGRQPPGGEHGVHV
jgi:hypothetical protein